MNVDAHTQARCKAKADIIKALGHPTRLFIAEELARGERCVCELTDMVGADISTVSKHLSILKNAGIVQDEKRGTQVWYSLKCPCILDFIYCVEKVVQDNARESLKLLE